jgi:hypothetical protein
MRIAYPERILLVTFSPILGRTKLRKLLLAGAAMLGVTAGGQNTACAQTPPAPQLAAPQMQTLIPAYSGKSANSNNNYQAAALPGSVANPTPGTMVVRLNGVIRLETTIEGSTGDKVGGNKEAPYNIGSFIRLYPGVDAMATNGLRWGAQAEIRENFQGQGYIANGTAVGGNSVSGGLTSTNAQNSSSSTGASGLTSAQTLYVRRAFIYLAEDKIGIFRLGQGDSVAGIFDNGVTTFQNVGVGLWNGDAELAINANTQPSFPWLSQDGSDYGTERIVYLSPQLAGVDFGISYAPNNGNLAADCSIAGQGCASLSSSSQVNNSVSGTPTDNFRFRNQIQGGIRYQGTLGPAAIYAFGDYIGSGVVNYTGPPVVGGVTPGVPVGSKYDGKTQGVNAGFVGAAVTIGGFQFGGAWQGGTYNGTMAVVPQHGAAKANAYLVGFKYTNGPYSIGGAWYGFDSQGATQLTGISQRHENAFALGGNWQITPGLQAFFEGLYGTRHQGDYNFVTASVGKGYNNTRAEALLLGLIVSW